MLSFFRSRLSRHLVNLFNPSYCLHFSILSPSSHLLHIQIYTDIMYTTFFIALSNWHVSSYITVHLFQFHFILAKLLDKEVASAATISALGYFCNIKIIMRLRVPFEKNKGYIFELYDFECIIKTSYLLHSPSINCLSELNSNKLRHLFVIYK